MKRGEFIDSTPKAEPVQPVEPQSTHRLGPPEITDTEAVTTSCLINHYNYGEFIVDAVQSVLSQSQPVDEILIIDDGSEDGSREILREAFADNPKIQIVEKENGGQLSCFNVGVARCQKDIVLFLDADDCWDRDYVTTVTRAFLEDPDCDYTVCAYQKFGQSDERVQVYDRDQDRGFGAVLALAENLELLDISPTSTLAIRRSVLTRFLPLPFEELWKSRADDCLFYGAALSGARRRYLADPLVRYRVHDNNLWHGRQFDRGYEFRRRLAVSQLVQHLLHHLSLGPELARLAPREFKTIAHPTYRNLKTYLRIVWHANLSLPRKWKLTKALVRDYRRAKFGKDQR